MALFDRLKKRLKKRLSKTRSALSDSLSGLFRGGRPMDDALLGELEEILYGSDLGPLASELIADLSRRHKRGQLKGEQDVRAALREDLCARIPLESGEIELSKKPTVVLIVGVNGSGKTTTVAKLAHRLKTVQEKRVLVGACDTYRAAGAEQLEIWAQRAGVEIVRKGDGADPAAVAYEAVDRGLSGDFDVVLLDTAGRLHTQTDLMAELGKVVRVVAKRLEGAPHETWLVLDGTNGQNAIQQAKLFMAAVPVGGIIVTKLDGTARGGAVFTIGKELGLPVRYIGTGETMELLEPFEPSAFVQAVLGSA